MPNQRVIFNHGGKTYSGTVNSAANYPIRNLDVDRDAPDAYAENWYVEFHHDEKSAGPTGQAGYVKQVPDGVGNLRFEAL